MHQESHSVALYSPESPWCHGSTAGKCWSWKPGCGAEDESKTVSPLKSSSEEFWDSIRRGSQGLCISLAGKILTNSLWHSGLYNWTPGCLHEHTGTNSFGEGMCIREALIICYILRTLLKRAKVGSLWSALTEQFLHVNLFNKVSWIFSQSSCATESPELELTRTAVSQ